MKSLILSRIRIYFAHLASLLALLVLPSSVPAAAPMAKTQAPGFYRMMLGRFEVTAYLDGVINLDSSLLRDISQADVQKLLKQSFFDDPRKIPTSCNTYLINTGSKLILVDAGGGQVFGPAFGMLPENLKASGYKPEQIDIVLITHLHGDHFGGLLANGKPAFPNATIYVSKAENDFWTSDEPPKLNVSAAMQEHFDSGRKLAKKTAMPYLVEGRWKTFENADLPVADVTAVPIPGHTPGHTAYAFTSGGKTLTVIGDTVHVAAVQFPRPGAAVSFDADSPQAIATRKALFKRLAESESLVAGMHLAFPGLGRLRADGDDSYAFVPLEFTPLPKEK
jgi:glyoxylase-like metal-dependent hydrolase (beta-lactamase superfamily II)